MKWIARVLLLLVGGVALCAQGASPRDLRKQIAALNKQIKREATSELYARRGVLRHQLGQSPEWIDDCIRSYMFDDIADEGVGELVAVTDSLGRELIISRFELLGGGSADLLSLEAAILHGWGMYDRALVIYDGLVDSGVADEDIYYWYNDCKYRLQLQKADKFIAAGEPEEAITLLDALIERYPDREELYRLKIRALEALKAELER